MSAIKGMNLLESPEARAEYERLRPGFELAHTLITAGVAAGLFAQTM